MAVVIMILDNGLEGAYVKEFDPLPNQDGKGLGHLTITGDILEAKVFPSFTEAAEFWRQQSPTVPVRSHDGRPNRPLTAYSVTFPKVQVN